MRHRKRTIKLGRTSSHRKSMLSNMVCSLIDEKRIITTLPKARAARSLAEKMVTLGKAGDLAARRRAISLLKNKKSVSELFSAVAPAFQSRQGGYTRILKLGPRQGDGAEEAILEWVDYVPPVKKAKDAGKDKAKPEAKPEAKEAKPEASPAKDTES
ncbi:MAG TPA: 50S ribosomal protein L17 [Kiritimatiellia bacterium]|nr:50S ribosomal protein L17 [Kiritimatiellia bacterium]